MKKRTTKILYQVAAHVTLPDYLQRGGFYSQFTRAAHLNTWLWLKCIRFVERRGNFWVGGTRRADLILLWYKAGFPGLSCCSIVYPACQALIKKLQAPAPAPASLILALLWCEPPPKPANWSRLKSPNVSYLDSSEAVWCLASARGEALVADLKSETKLGNGVHLSSKPIIPHSISRLISIQRMCRKDDPESRQMTYNYSNELYVLYKML